MPKNKFASTVRACYVGYVVQAIVINFSPLLFLTFVNDYGIGTEKIAFLITINFGVQLLIDFLSAYVIDRLGARLCVVTAHAITTVGLICYGLLPTVLPNPYIGLLLATLLCAIGSGMIEVLISPFVEACATSNKGAAMSLLHSFYCWGHLAVILISTLFFRLFGIDNWHYLAYAWALVPLCNGISFLRVPIATLKDEGRSAPVSDLVKKPVFWLLLLMMMTSGASEQAMAQWASAFAEQGLGVSKTVGDLAGPCVFAFMMGCTRAFYGRFGEKIRLDFFLIGSAALTIVTYLITALSANPIVGLIGCGMCGLSVGIMWPGCLSLSTAAIPTGGTALFSMLALGGDFGCITGPDVVGFAEDMKSGILTALIFPSVLLVCVILLSGYQKKNRYRN